MVNCYYTLSKMTLAHNADYVLADDFDRIVESNKTTTETAIHYFGQIQRGEICAEEAENALTATAHLVGCAGDL